MKKNNDRELTQDEIRRFEKSFEDWRKANPGVDRELTDDEMRYWRHLRRVATQQNRTLRALRKEKAKLEAALQEQKGTLQDQTAMLTFLENRLKAEREALREGEE